MKAIASASAALVAALAVLALVAVPAPASAQSCPDKVIRVIVPYAPGTTDQQARVLAKGMEKVLGQTIIVENRGGAGGGIGTLAVARAAPDGCTLLYASTAPLTVVPLISNVAYTYDEVTPVAQVMASPHLLAARADAPFKNLDEMVAYAKANPGKLNFGSTGTGSAVHLAGMAFAKQAGIQIVHVPFQGLAPAITAALGGHVDFVVGLPIVILPQIAAGKLRPIVQMGATRAAPLPDVPTAMEKGIKVDLISNHGFFVPKATPAGVIATLQKAVETTMNGEEWRQFCQQHHEAPKFATAADFKRELDAEKDVMASLVKEFTAKEKQ
jgi:tripartite-type tricarboxylate transporter receptor subunit TctC